ncbi:hypothetical protein [Algoriphagus antarcticus]|uniref:Uncharacterized protein n=1 Tax=Algoriphagus antarcticus TaxID=238540 RepID=A0A3E0D6N3_9BACT|nr:hypothetical protein [Algoriphagus antarcticus]REG78360.1 hypothetical protein C8N25_1352 [Algoriphagus antarcticus]
MGENKQSNKINQEKAETEIKAVTAPAEVNTAGTTDIELKSDILGVKDKVGNISDKDTEKFTKKNLKELKKMSGIIKEKEKKDKEKRKEKEKKAKKKAQKKKKEKAKKEKAQKKLKEKKAKKKAAQKRNKSKKK